MPVYKVLRDNLYGVMDIQIGYCNGVNSTMNGFEYHIRCEVNIVVTDQSLFMVHTWELKENTFDEHRAEVFYVEKG